MPLFLNKIPTRCRIQQSSQKIHSKYRRKGGTSVPKKWVHKLIFFTQQYDRRKNEVLLPHHHVKLNYHSEILSFLAQKFANLWLKTTLSHKHQTLPTCQVISRQLQEFVSRRVRIWSNLGVLHPFKPRTVKVSLMGRSFEFNDQLPCTHRLLSLSHRSLTFIILRQIQNIQCVIVSLCHNIVVVIDSMLSR